MESVTRVAPAEPADVAELAAVAADTFPLACPPSVAPADIASFIDANLSDTRFAEYLSDPQRTILIARQDDRIVGYTMLIRGAEDDRAELSKMYVLPAQHGSGVATALMDAALVAVAEWRAECVWLGVNQKNERAQRFYAKSGFAVSGTRTFQLGAHAEHDYVMVRPVP
ncbi:MAG: GNAT family N-acetyltransferase [Mycobacterium sp.]